MIASWNASWNAEYAVPTVRFDGGGLGTLVSLSSSRILVLLADNSSELWPLSLLPGTPNTLATNFARFRVMSSMTLCCHAGGRYGGTWLPTWCAPACPPSPPPAPPLTLLPSPPALPHSLYASINPLLSHSADCCCCCRRSRRGSNGFPSSASGGCACLLPLDDGCGGPDDGCRCPLPLDGSCGCPLPPGCSEECDNVLGNSNMGS